ncbi:protein of unknown function [Algoriphagus locisalis]|uniref:DUF4221 domain-containing protein n=1 Tax=Algoriphagus locisalis TaxID=305507 RepID=A0A1I7APA7_9BACT|nr:DUF4221 family protein [Algoriphagus locisalis]SFT76726.1 protein of unknown function [Algoriphagus locisalis]
MNKLCFLLFAFIATGCSSEKKSESSVANAFDFSYTIDTVMIDADDEFLFLNMELYFSDYSAKEGLLYNLNPQSGRVEVIDLDNRKLAKLVQYELEGPNGILEMALVGIKKASSGDSFFMNYYSINHLDSSDSKIASYRLTNDFLNGEKLAENEEIDGMGQIDSRGEYFSSFYGNYQEKGGIRGVAQIHLADSSLSLIPLEFWGDLDKYEVNMDQGGGRAISAPEAKFLVANGEGFIVSTTAINELWQYSKELDSVIHRQYSSQFTENIKPGKFPQTANNQEEFDQLIQQKVDEVVFGPLVKDESSGRFYRYSREWDKSDNKYTYVLTIFDENLDQLHEEKMREEVSIPGKYMPGSKTFVHEGILYSFLNIEDEMAFVRLKPTFD